MDEPTVILTAIKDILYIHRTILDLVKDKIPFELRLKHGVCFPISITIFDISSAENSLLESTFSPFPHPDTQRTIPKIPAAYNFFILTITLLAISNLYFPRYRLTEWQSPKK